MPIDNYSVNLTLQVSGQYTIQYGVQCEIYSAVWFFNNFYPLDLKRRQIVDGLVMSFFCLKGMFTTYVSGKSGEWVQANADKR